MFPRPGSVRRSRRLLLGLGTAVLVAFAAHARAADRVEASRTAAAALIEITGFSPAVGSQGATVTITGTGFAGAITKVLFNGSPANFTIVSDAQITAIVPLAATAGPISLVDAAIPDTIRSTAWFYPPGWRLDGVPLGFSPSDERYGIAVPDGAGGIIAAWADAYLTGSNVYAQRMNAVGQPMWDPTGVPVRSGIDTEIPRGMISDGTGGVIIVWEDTPYGGPTSLFAQRLSADGHLLWASAGVLIATGTGGSPTPTLASDGAGGVIVVWADTRNGTLNSDIYAQRVNAQGAVLWTAYGVPVCTAPVAGPARAGD